MPSGLQIEDERQAKVVDRFRTSARLQAQADLLETSLEEMKTVLYETLKPKPKPAPALRTASAEKCRGLIYLLYDQRDQSQAATYTEALFDAGFEVVHPTFEGDEGDVRRDHEDNLALCDGALVLFGSPNEGWVRRKLREVQKAVGYGRTAPIGAVAVAALPPETAEKGRFRTHDAEFFPYGNNACPQGLLSFFARLSP